MKQIIIEKGLIDGKDRLKLIFPYDIELVPGSNLLTADRRPPTADRRPLTADPLHNRT